MPATLLQMANLRMQASNRLGCEFVEVVHASINLNAVEAVVRDACGFLWICRESSPSEGRALIDRSTLGSVPFFMPIYGPCPDPVEALPVGYSAHSTAMLAEAAAIIKRGGVRKVAA